MIRPVPSGIVQALLSCLWAAWLFASPTAEAAYCGCPLTCNGGSVLCGINCQTQCDANYAASQTLRDALAAQRKKDEEEFQGGMAVRSDAYFSKKEGSQGYAAAKRDYEELRDRYNMYLLERLVPLGIDVLKNGMSDYSKAMGFDLWGNLMPVPPTMQRQLRDWVEGVRSSLGGGVLYGIPADRFAKAVEANRPLYKKYADQFDSVMYRAWRHDHPQPEDQAGRGRLAGEWTMNMSGNSPMARNLYRRPAGDPLHQEIRVAELEGARFLRCSYGPSFDEQGNQSWRDIWYWTPRAPANLQAILQADKDQILADVSGFVAAKCPRTEPEATADRASQQNRITALARSPIANGHAESTEAAIAAARDRHQRAREACENEIPRSRYANRGPWMIAISECIEARLFK